jgi:tetratricopeptide (TPR) repeat protein
MPRPDKLTAVSPAALQVAVSAAPSRAKWATEGLEGAESSAALERLNAALSELKALAAEPLVRRAANALNAGDHQAGAKWALKALEKDENNGSAWYVLAFARERAGDFASSVSCYERALALLPSHDEIANDLGRLAFRMGMREQAKKLFAHYIQRHPGNLDAINNLACVLRDDGEMDQAIGLLQETLQQHPESAMLWNTLGTTVSERGDSATAQIFYEEALRLQPDFAKARYNLGNTRLVQGDAETALACCNAALGMSVTEDERQMMLMSKATILMTLGRIVEGWECYESRLHHQFDDALFFLIDRPQWKPGDALAGKSLLVVAEQGLGDEVLFANVLEDLIAAVGPSGKVTLAVEPRLVTLFQRSYPNVRVGAHATWYYQARSVRTIPFLGEDMSDIDLWTPIASTFRQFRTRLDDFPARDRYLHADPERIAHWRKVLQEQAPAGPKVGLLWKSAIANTQGRGRYFSSFDAWEPVLATSGVSFVNLQYGDCSAEIAQAKRDFGVELWTPPGIDLKQDLDDLAALCCAMDLIVGFSNATVNIGAACGAPTWLISTPGVWTRLGTDRYPWYPQVEVFLTDDFGDWDGVMGRVADALGGFAKGGTGAAPAG